MTEYIPPVLWALSSVYCGLLDKQRHVKPTAIRNMAYARLGPVAIPLVLAARQKATSDRFNRLS